MINKNTGEIEISEVKVGPKFRKRNFIESSLYAQVIHEESITYSRYVLKPQKIDNEIFAVVLYFKQEEQLEFVSLSILPDQKMPSWENWSKEEQLQKKRANDKWLEKQLGPPPYKYGWGELSSLYDPRSATSTITIRYLLSTEE